MFQDDRIFTGLLVVLSILVVGLVAALVVLARSLRASKPTRTSRASPKLAARGESASAISDVSITMQPDEGVPLLVAGTSSDDAMPVGEAPEMTFPTTEEDQDDVTRVAPSGSSSEIPRLAADREERASDSGPQALEESIARLLYEPEAEIDIDEPTGPNDVILVSAMGQTDRGVIRRRNEDAYLIDTSLQLYAVADGMGGYAGGDVASRLAVQEVWNAMKAPHDPKAGYEGRPRRGRELIAAVERANDAVYLQSQTTRALQGMGTTLVAARFSPRKQRMYVAHVGDSRCYRLRRGELQMLTKDHTLAARGIQGPMGQNISRAIGVEKTVKVDLIVDKPLPEDIFLLCTDGLPKMVTDEQIQKLLTLHEGSLPRAAAQLVLAANAGGGRDNITVVLVRILEITATMRTAAVVKAQKRVEFGPS